jgi:hypothetical protein
MTRHEKFPLTHTIAERKHSTSPLSPARWMIRHARIFEEHTAVPSPQRAAHTCRPQLSPDEEDACVQGNEHRVSTIISTRSNLRTRIEEYKQGTGADNVADKLKILFLTNFSLKIAWTRRLRRLWSRARC